jgi:hypothetical protein
MADDLKAARVKYADDVEEIEVAFDKRRLALKRRHQLDLDLLAEEEERTLSAARDALRKVEESQ